MQLEVAIGIRRGLHLADADGGVGERPDAALVTVPLTVPVEPDGPPPLSPPQATTRQVHESRNQL